MSKSDELKPGRELDALIAEKVMGISVTYEQGDYWPPARPGKNFSTQPIPQYSWSIEAAFEVVEKLRPNFSFSLHDTGEDWECWLSSNGGKFLLNADTENLGRGETAPHAICLVALKALADLDAKDSQ